MLSLKYHEYRLRYLEFDIFVEQIKDVPNHQTVWGYPKETLVEHLASLLDQGNFISLGFGSYPVFLTKPYEMVAYLYSPVLDMKIHT